MKGKRQADTLLATPRDLTSGGVAARALGLECVDVSSRRKKKGGIKEGKKAGGRKGEGRWGAARRNT
ncbi:hypothetical protein E2C01_028835 [Portunus trituberculatus]|uniref:Uncharacterized protein n=1 Tax=Portunus trituberculatus TaxID=210409 RepID=A0A5B7ER41_PORTR|nr:hypothetical protein [Portunus trituberculatus]